MEAREEGVGESEDGTWEGREERRGGGIEKGIRGKGRTARKRERRKEMKANER